MTMMEEQAYMDRFYGNEPTDFRVMWLLIARLKGDPSKKEHRFRGYIETHAGIPIYVVMSERAACKLNTFAGREIVKKAYDSGFKEYVHRAPLNEFDSCVRAHRPSKA